MNKPGFSKVLVANRGEIAQRIIIRAKALGYRTVAVYSEPDSLSPHVRLADEAVCIGQGLASDSYLNVDKLLSAARTTGSDAIHPGYGFLSENSEFARACGEKGIRFIGPDPKAIELMGSKRASKVAMLEANVPCIPGYEEPQQDDAALLAAALDIGFPLMVKASAGGGGRGMRVVAEKKQLNAAIKSARSEALSAFGSDELILEKALTHVRHIEIQIFADTYGNVVYLGERDCSMQRRHQKVIEEAPSLALTPELRITMGEAAVMAARACHYVGAGTVEFLLTDQHEFYFLEMNTRLQVEHPVTEWVTQLDLIEWQLRIAAGEPLPLTQKEITLNGHAIEVRLYAEDPADHFMPQTGTIALWQPALMDDVSGEAYDGLRVDSGIKQGNQITAHYDPMLAKLIAYGVNREQARRRLLRLVQDSHLLGVRDNRAFLSELLASETFIEGRTTTDFIGQHFVDNDSVTTQVVTAEEWAIAALLMVVDTDAKQTHSFRSANVGERRVKLRCQLKGHQEAQQWGVVQLSQNQYQIVCYSQEASDKNTSNKKNQSVQIELMEFMGHQLRYRVQGVMKTVTFCFDEPHSKNLTQTVNDGMAPTLWLASVRGNLPFSDITLRVRKTDHVGSDQIVASMDGVIVDVLVTAGQSVQQGDVLMVLEAMKMEHPLKAEMDAVVDEVYADTGDQVKGRQLLMLLSASLNVELHPV